MRGSTVATPAGSLRQVKWIATTSCPDAGLSHSSSAAAVLPRIEEALRPFRARPHWGKRHGFDRAAIERVHPRLADARAVYERLDPRGRFSNVHLERVGVREER